MIRGINRQIIEITDISNIYYEKAILFVKPEYAEFRRDVLEKQAKNFLKSIGKPASIKRKKRIIYYSLRFITSALIGAIITAICLLSNNCS